MSTILKALRRLEQEKSSQSDRPLGEAVANTPPPPAPLSTRTPWLIAAGSVVGAFAVTATLLLWFRGDPEPVSDAATITQAPSPADSKAVRSLAASPSRRAAEAGAHADARQPQRLPVPSETAAATGLSPAALSSPDVEVVALPGPPVAEEEAGAAEAVVLRRREPPRPGAGMARPLALVKPPRPIDQPDRVEPLDAIKSPGAAEPLKSIVRAEPPVEVAAAVSPLKPARTTVVARAPSAPPQAQGESPESVIVAASPPAPPKREPPASAPTSEPKVMTKATTGSAEPEPEAAAPRVSSRESTERTDRTPALTAPATKSPPRPAAPEAKTPVDIAAVVPPVKRASPPRPAVKPAPAPKTSVPALPREVLKTLPAPTELSTAPRPAASDVQVYVERTIWHPIADRRVAIVSLGESAEAVELREGESLGPFVVGEIEPTGVYFQRGDDELRRRVGAR